MFQGQIGRSIQNDRIRELHGRSMAAQRREDARAFRAAQRHAPRSIRRSIGRSIVRVGEAIAAESNPQPAAS